MQIMFEQAIRFDLGAWFETFGRIRLKSGAIAKPECNELQKEVSRVIGWCKENKKPIRLILLKPRQKGCSTISIAALHHMSAYSDIPVNSCVIGGAHEQSENLMGKILRTYAETDEFSPDKFCTVSNAKPIVAKWGNGSTCKQMTARNPEAGRSGTFQAIILTEFARWAEEGVADAKKVANGLLKGTGFIPGTMIIMESTAAGASGDFYDRYQKAVTFEESKAGKAGYIKIFMPWFVFEDSKRR